MTTAEQLLETFRGEFEPPPANAITTRMILARFPHAKRTTVDESLRRREASGEMQSRMWKRERWYWPK